MALLFMEGFDDVSTVAELQELPYVVANGAGINLTTGRSGSGNAVQLANAVEDLHFTLYATSGTTYYMGFAMYVNADHGSSASAFMYTASTAGTQEITLRQNTNGTISVLRGASTVLGTGTETTTVDAWTHIVLKIFINNSTGTVELWVNGTKDLDLTSQDTLAGATANIDRVSFQGGSSYLIDIDDIYVGDTTGTDMTDQQGDCTVEMLLPSGAGNSAQFTASPAVANYLNCDEADPDDDTTYNHSATATHKDTYAMGNLTGNVDTVHAVKVRCRVRKEDAGNRLVNTVLRNSATEADSGQLGVSLAYRYIEDTQENDPNGGGNWTESTVNTIEAGLEIGT